MSTKDNSLECTEKENQRTTRRQANAKANATAKDMSKPEAYQASTNVLMDFTVLTTDIKMTVAAVVEEKMAVISKLEIIQNTLGCNSQRSTEAETHISSVEDVIVGLETRLKRKNSLPP